MEKKINISKISLVHDNQISRLACENYVPNIGDNILADNMVQYCIVKVSECVSITSDNVVETHYICVGERKEDDNLVGVLQTKIIQFSNSYAQMEEDLNKFLSKVRNTHCILDIMPNKAYIMVKYMKYNSNEIELNRAKLLSYQNNGALTKCSIGGEVKKITMF